jgi:hypothetical protein
MKTSIDVRTAARAITRHAAKPLLAAFLTSAATLAAAAQAPSPLELEHCLRQAGIELNVAQRDMRLLSAQKFALEHERHMIALNTEIALGSAAMSPRLYCTVERDGAISTLQSMPRLPLRPATELVAK